MDYQSLVSERQRLVLRQAELTSLISETGWWNAFLRSVRQAELDGVIQRIRAIDAQLAAITTMPVFSPSINQNVSTVAGIDTDTLKMVGFGVLGIGLAWFFQKNKI